MSTPVLWCETDAQTGRSGSAAPNFFSVSPGSATGWTSATATLGYGDPDGDPLRLTWSSNPSGCSVQHCDGILPGGSKTCQFTVGNRGPGARCVFQLQIRDNFSYTWPWKYFTLNP